MPLVIIAATKIEVDLIIDQLSRKRELAIQGKSFYTGFIENGLRAVISLCGVGKTNAAHGATLLIDRFKPDIVYNIGVAGSYPSSGLKIGDITIAEKEIYGDEGLITEDRKQKKTCFFTMDKLGLPLAVINGINYYNEYPMLIPEGFKVQSSKFKIKTGNFITVSSCTSTLKRAREMQESFGAICENMEGAAVAHICALSGIPVVEIRGISNIIKDRKAEPISKADIKKASENVQRFFLERICSI